MDNPNIAWHVNYANVRKQLVHDITENFFKETPDKLPQLHPMFSKYIDDVFSTKANKYISITYPIITMVEKLELTEEDIRDNPLVMPTDVKFKYLDSGKIDFDDGTDIFEKFEDAQSRLAVFLDKNMIELYTKVKTHYID